MKVLQDILVPQESVNDQTLAVIGLNFKNGDAVKKDDIVIELETSKAIITLEAEVDGYIVYHCKPDDEVPLNALVAQIVDEVPQNGLSPITQATESSVAINYSESVEVLDRAATQQVYETQFSNKALALMEKNNLGQDLFKNVDFVNEAVVLSYLNPTSGQNEANADKETNIKLKHTTPAKQYQNVSYEKVLPGKRREIEYLSAVQSSGLVSTLHVGINTAGLIDSVGDKFKYFKNSILPLVVFETSKLLNKYPYLNAFYDNGQIARYDVVNVGLAIDIDDGLKVVKVPATNTLSVFEIEEAIFSLSNKYLDKKLEVSDFTDITFTITDLSAVDTSFFTPLINKDNSAILGISKINDDMNQCMISVSFDHRVTSGKYVGNFLSELKARIESFVIEYKRQKTITADLICYKCLKNISEDLNDIGFIKVQTKSGEERLICDTCLFY